MATVGSLAVILTASATDFERTMGSAVRAVQSTEKEFMRSARRMEDIGRKWSLGVTGPIIAGAVAVSRAATSWEDDYASVRKTVSATEEQFTKLEKQLRDMTKLGGIPIKHKEVAAIAEAAGQLGIQVDNIESFTKTMAMVGTSTKLSSEEAAIALAQMDNIMQSGQRSFDRYGAAVVKLGNSLSTTGESAIVNFGLNIAGAGRIAKLSEAQVLGMGAAFASVGMEAEAGGTAISKVLANIDEAVATGNKNLKWLAATAGMTSAEFVKTWQIDSSGAFIRFVEGLGRSGTQAYTILNELGMSDARLKRGFLSVAGAGNLLRRSVDLATIAWDENVALVNEANERYKTFGSRLKMLWNSIYDIGITIGDAFSPLREALLSRVEGFVLGLTRLAEGFAKLPSSIRTAVGGFFLFLAAIGPTMLAFALLNRTIAGAIGVWGMVAARAAVVSFAFTAWRGGAAKLGEALSYLVGGPIKLTILAITAAIVAAVLLAANWDKVSRFFVAAWNVIGAAAMYGASLVVRGVGLILSAIAVIISPLRGVAQAVIGEADSLKASAGAALTAAKSVSSASGVAQQAADSQSSVAKAGQKAADSQDELAKATEGAGKAAGKNLQSFDEINQLQSNMASASPSLPEFAVPELPGVPAVGGGIGDIASSMGDQISSIADKASDAWNKLKQAMEPVNKAVQWIKDNWPTIGPIIEGIASIIMLFLVPALIKSGVEAMIAAGKHIAAWVMSSGAAIKHAAVIVWNLITTVAKWAWAGVEALIHAGKMVLAWALSGWEAAKQGAVMIGQLVIVVAKWAWAGIKAMAHAAKMAAAWLIALGPVAWVTAAVIALAVLIVANWDWIKKKTIEIWSAVSKWVSDKWNDIKNDADKIWGGIKKKLDDTWGAIKTSASNIWNAIKEFFKKWGDEILLIAVGPVGWAVLLGRKIAENWNNIKNTAAGIWNNLKSILSGLWNTIQSTARSVWDGIKNAIVSPIQSAKQTLMGIIDSIKNAFANMRITIPKPKLPQISVSTKYKTVGNINIPYPDFDLDWYARGGVFNNPAVIGVGESGAEAVMPLERNTGWIDVLAEKLAAAMGGGQGAGGGDIYVYIGNEQVEAYVHRTQDRRSTKGNGR